MHVNRIRVQNFRSIKDTGWVDVEDDITTLLGKNESGKTALLEAIEGFSDDQEYQSRDIRESDEIPRSVLPVCSLEFALDDEDREHLANIDEGLGQLERLPVTKFAGGVRVVDGLLADFSVPSTLVNVNLLKVVAEDITDILQEKEPDMPETQAANQDSSTLNNESELDKIKALAEDFHDVANSCMAEFNSKDSEHPKFTVLHSWLDFEASDITEGRLRSSEIICALPSFFYHNEADLLSDEIPIQAIEKDDYSTFRNLLTEVVGLDLEGFRQKPQMEQIREMDDVNSTISGEVNGLWSQKQVEVQINFANDTFYTFIKDIGVGDEEVDREPRNPSQRSQGFQWFLSFYINLSAVSESNGDNVVMLLDDPAVFLHPEGKKNWLTAIESIAEDNQVLYTSHSPYLIRKEYPARIRVVEDEEQEGTQISEELTETSGTALEPLREALGIGLGDSPFVSQRKVLVEGPSDYYILNGLANYSAEHVESDILSRSDVTILPTGGGDEMVWAAKWVKSEEFSYAILLDNDQKGGNVKDRLQEEAAELNEERVIKLTKDDDHRNYNIEVEDMFAPDFYIDCLNTVYSEQFEDYIPVSIEETDESWEIEGNEHNGRKIVNLVQEIFDERDRGDLDKVLVGKEIEDRLTSNRDVTPEDVNNFNQVLGRIRGAL